MIVHLSVNALDPAKVAAVLAELLGAADIAAPTPPFPPGARMVCRFDDRGSVGDYLALYGPENREHLDGQLREVEQLLRSQLQPTA